MLTSELTTRQDLVQSLDAESIYDYLIQHGILDEQTRDNIHSETDKIKRNKSLLEHLQITGDASLALFINALRQSGQMGLASSLDVNSRIKPTYGYGYLGKDRHKGQVTIKIIVDSIKALFPKQEEGDQLEEKHGDTPEKEVKSSGTNLNELNVLMTPRRMHKSYENMTMIEDPGGPITKVWKIHEYSYDGRVQSEEEEEEAVKSRGFCWCLCIPRRKRAKKNKYIQNGGSHNRGPTTSSERILDTSIPLERLSHSPAKSSNSFSPRRAGGKSVQSIGSKGTQVQSDSSCDVQSRTSTSHSTASDKNYLQNSKLNNADKKTVKNEKKTKKNSNTSTNNQVKGKENKPQTTPVKRAIQQIYDAESFNDKMEEPVEFCIMWKSRGPTFDAFAKKFQETVDSDSGVRSKIVKYFEQERGTLILSVYCEDTLVICNICMTVEQISALHSDERSGMLTQVLESMILKQSVIDQVGVVEMKIQVVVDDDEIELAKEELS